MPLTQVQAGMMDSTAQYYSFKNRIINGAMSFWQRGTSFTNPTASNFYTADRWGVNRAGDVTGATVSQSTDVPAGFQYSLRLQRTAGNASTAGLYLFNSNESVNTLDLAGQVVTLSFWVKAGANYSGGAISLNVNSGTGTDQRVYAYTGSATFISTTQTITSTWTRYSFTGTVSASATEIGFQLFWTPTGTAGADDSVYITGVQLEKGSTATSFDYRPYGTELALCQRYCQIVKNGVGCWVSSTQCQINLAQNTEMRAAPTLSQTGVLTVTDYVALDATQSSTSIAVLNTNTAYGTVATISNFSGATTGRVAGIRPYSSYSGYILMTAEL